MIIVTGGAGFIGSNLILGLNGRGYDDVLVVDNLADGIIFKNLLEGFKIHLRTWKRARLYLGWLAE